MKIYESKQTKWNEHKNIISTANGGNCERKKNRLKSEVLEKEHG